MKKFQDLFEVRCKNCLTKEAVLKINSDEDNGITFSFICRRCNNIFTFDDSMKIKE